MTDATSMVDLSSPTSQTELNPSSEPKLWKDKSWSERRRTKFFGVSCLRLCIIGGILTFVVIVLAAVLGAYYSGQARGRTQATADMLLDAQLASPADGPRIPLPMGTYSLRPGPPQEAQSECLPVSNQAPAWSCDLAAYNAMAIRVDQIPNSPNQSATIFDINAAVALNGSGYGTLLPAAVASTPLSWVMDRDAQYRGPAWQFQAMYQKIVVARPDALALSSSSSSRFKAMKRDWYDAAKTGDRPWFCYWNQTLLEVFVYPQYNSTAFRAMGNGTSPVTQNGMMPNRVGKREDSSVLSVASARGSTTVTGTSSSTSVVASSTTVSTPSSSADSSPQLDLYPFVVKIEERRPPGSNTAPVCVQKQLMNDGSFQTVTDASGAPVQIQLKESGPDLAAYESTYGSTTTIDNKKRDSHWPDKGMMEHSLSNKAIVRGSCHCQWMSGDL